MRNRLIMLLLIGGFNSAWAETSLPFPTSEADIVKALTPKPIARRDKKGFGSDVKGVKSIRNDSPKVGALILFDFDSAIIKPESYSLLREFANALQGDLSDVQIEIGGHTDNMGSETYNLVLSEQRAQAVKTFLVSVYGIASNRLTTQAHGESQPIEPNNTEFERMMNRRVEFVRN
jgi:outer membrane protein OmpA-like peptidoglycan-associated protein